MGRKSFLINDLKREYLLCSNPDKDKIVEGAIIQLKALTKV